MRGLVLITSLAFGIWGLTMLNHRRRWNWLGWLPCSKNDLAEMEKRIMSAISEFADKVKAHTARVGTALSGIKDDITELKDLVAKLQGSQGQLSTEDQATLNEVEAKLGELATQVEGVDAMTPPPAPPG